MSNLIESESNHDNFLGIDLARIGFFIKPACSTSKLSTTANHIAALIDKPDNKLLLYSAVLEFIHWQLEAFKTQAINENLSLRERFQLELARDYLLKDLSQPPTIANIAAVVGLHPGKLKKGFKQMYGDSIYAHFQKARMKKATTLLKDNNVTETAMILGYSNVSHFNKEYILIDTAGVRKRKKVSDVVEKFSVIKTLQAIEDFSHLLELSFSQSSGLMPLH